MNPVKMYDLNYGITGVSGPFAAYGSFGVIDGAMGDLRLVEETESGFTANYETFSVSGTFETLENGVVSRQDVFVAKEEQVISDYRSRFFLEGGEYEVYTQYNSWQHESAGGWQPLITGVQVCGGGIRSTDGAAPMMALKNKATSKILVFHLFPNAQWKMSVSKKHLTGKKEVVVLEVGFDNRGLNLKCSAQEKIKLPRLLYFEAEREIDLDAWKLHRVCNRLFPRKNLPVIYNTWLMNFHMFDAESVLRQMDCAAELGIENFLIDAGWYGKAASWFGEVGNWTENLCIGFRGRMLEVAEYARKKGLKFGLWMEPERAQKGTEGVTEHPDYYISVSGSDTYFLDFANPKAVDYIFKETCRLIDTYQLECMKFDFNDSLLYDTTGDGFYRYFQGQRQFVERLHTKYPQIYLSNCASGGCRMDLEQNSIYESIWCSDNQGPFQALRIIKDTAKRLPPNAIERFDVRTYTGKFPEIGKNMPERVFPMSCLGEKWDYVMNVTPAYTHGLITGGIMGFSCNIADYPEEEKAALKEMIARYKIDREFYKQSETRLLCDVENITVMQHNDKDFNRVIIQVFTRVLFQHQVTVYPVLDASSDYEVNGQTMSGKQIMNEGLVVCPADHDCVTVEYIKK